jgi:hypothetical protein
VSGSIRPVVNRECAAVITNTGNNLAVPSSSGIRFGGNHRSHCAASPAAQVSRSAGSTGRCSGRNRFTLSLNHRIDPVHSTRSASTVAGMSGVCSNKARTRASKTVNDVVFDVRSYLGGASEFTALMTVFLEIPNRCAMRAFGTPSAANLLINAQSSKVITLQSLSAHYSPPKLFSFRAPSTMAGTLARKGRNGRETRYRPVRGEVSSITISSSAAPSDPIARFPKSRAGDAMLLGQLRTNSRPMPLASDPRLIAQEVRLALGSGFCTHAEFRNGSSESRLCSGRSE